jgi:hypothetical protein
VVCDTAIADVKQLVKDAEQQVILYCSQGGVLEPNDNYRKGWQTRWGLFLLAATGKLIV